MITSSAGLEFLGHDEPPGGILGNHIKAVGIGQTI